MKIKLFIVLALVLLAVATWFFKTQKSDTPAPSLTKPDISTEVSGIRAVQTNAQTGEIEYELTAERLTQNSKTGRDELINAKLLWTATADEHYEIVAPLAYLDKESGNFVFEQGFLLQKTLANNEPVAKFQGSILTGNLNDKTLASSEPLTAIFYKKTGTDTFDAVSFRGELATGIYEFEQIQSEFAPVLRQDKPLF